MRSKYSARYLVSAMELAHVRKVDHVVRRLVGEVTREVLNGGHAKWTLGFDVVDREAADRLVVEGREVELTGVELDVVTSGGVVVRAWATT